MVGGEDEVEGVSGGRVSDVCDGVDTAGTALSSGWVRS
jgi:hypothetical protein